MGSGLTTATKPDNRSIWAKFEWRVLKLKEAHGCGDDIKSRAIAVNKDFSSQRFDWTGASIPAAQPVPPTHRRKLDGKFQHRSKALGGLPVSLRVSASDLIPSVPYVKSYDFK